jgi:anti-anti-sigma factor
MDLDIEVDTSAAGIVILRVRGSLDMQSRTDLIQVGQRALGAGPVSTFALDLTDVTFMDSTGVGALVELSRDAEDANAAFRIDNPSVRVRRILDLTGLSEAWDTNSDAPEPG